MPPADEGEFRREIDALLPWRTRIAAITCLLVNGGFMLFDALSLSGAPLVARASVRLLFTPLYLAVFWLAPRAWGRAHPQLSVLGLALAQAVELAALGAWLPPSESVGFFPALLFFPIFLPLPRARRVLLVSIFVGAFAFAGLFVHDWPAWAVLKHAGNLLATGVVALLAAHLDDKLARGEFRARRDLADANARLTAARSVRDQFFADVSHELRTPLTSALLALEAESSSAVRPLRRLQKLVDEMLQLSRLDAGALHRTDEVSDVAAVLRRLTADFKSAFVGKGLRLSVELPEAELPAPIGEEALEKVAVNLIGNALKYTPSGGSVAVRAAEQGGEVVLEVEDDGPGIAAPDLQHIFDRFVRIESRSGAPGSGIGLALAKELTELHGGSITCESEPGRVTVFRARWPRHEGSQEATFAQSKRHVEEAVAAAVDGSERLPSARLAHDEHAPLVLVIEDHLELAQRVAAALAPAVRAVTAHDGPSGVEQARKLVPELIVCDVLLPGFNGHEVVRRVREDPGTHAIPILLLSALAEREHVLSGLQAGADDTMAKPFDAEMLRARVDALLRLKRRRDGAVQAAELLRSVCQGFALALGYDTVAVLTPGTDGVLGVTAWGGTVAPPARSFGRLGAPWLGAGAACVLTGRSDAPDAASAAPFCAAAPLKSSQGGALIALGSAREPSLESLSVAASCAGTMLDRERSMGALAQLADEKQRLSSAILAGQDAERRRLSLELHDGPGQTLVGALLHLDLELRALGVRPELQRARGLVAQALADLRAVSRDLHPPALQQYGLVQTLRTLAESCATEQMMVQADIDPAVPGELPSTMSLGLFRIAQAALANSVTHARAAQTVLRLHEEEGELVLEIEDNGVGFVPSRTEHGVGVPGMRERAASLGGRILIQSDLGRGTLVRATVPLARPN